METAALLAMPVAGLVLGLAVFWIARRDARSHQDRRPDRLAAPTHH